MRRVNVTSFFATAIAFVLYDEVTIIMRFFFSINYAAVPLVIFFYVSWAVMVGTMFAQMSRDSLARLVVTDNKFDADSDEATGLTEVTDSLESIARLTVVMRACAVLMVLVLGLRILQSFHAHLRLGVLARTIASALRQFRWVFGIFVVVILTFSVSGTLLFGHRVEGFASLKKSMQTCIHMLFGTFDYSTVQYVYRPAPMLFYWSYMVLVSLVLLSMMLAIVVEAYTEVSSGKNQVAKNMSTGRVLKNIFWDAIQLPMVMRKRLEACRGKFARASVTSWVLDLGTTH